MNLVCGMWYMEPKCKIQMGRKRMQSVEVLPPCTGISDVHVPYAHMSHHLHLILLYSPQHLLPISSALHHDDPSHWPHTMELHCPGKGVKEQTKSNIQIHIITSMYMYGYMQWA